jgi:hypothetical protein
MVVGMGMTRRFYDAVFLLIARPPRLPLRLPGLHQAVGSAARPGATAAIVVAATPSRLMLLLLVMRGISRRWLHRRRDGCCRRWFLFLPLQRKEELFGAAESLLGTDLIGPAAAAGRGAILWRRRLGGRGRPRLRLEEAGGERLGRGQVLQPPSGRSWPAP